MEARREVNQPEIPEVEQKRSCSVTDHLDLNSKTAKNRIWKEVLCSNKLNTCKVSRLMPFRSFTKYERLIRIAMLFIQIIQHFRGGVYHFRLQSFTKLPFVSRVQCIIFTTFQ